MLYLGADHRGFVLKEFLKGHLAGGAVAFEDLGDSILVPDDDYVDYAISVARAVVADSSNRGILICGSGIGMAVAANKVRGVRAGLVTDPQQAVAARTEDDTNVLVLDADLTTPDRAAELVDQWLDTPFSGLERHVRRLEKIKKLEAKS